MLDSITGDSKEAHFGHTIKHLMKEKIFDCWSACNLIIRTHNIRLKIFIIANISLKSMSGSSIYNNIKNN